MLAYAIVLFFPDSKDMFPDIAVQVRRFGAPVVVS